MRYAYYQGIPLEKFIEFCRQYLQSRGCTENHIEEQVKKIYQSGSFYHKKKNSNSCWLISIEKSENLSYFDGKRVLGSELVVNIVDGRRHIETVIELINFFISSSFNLQKKVSYQQRKDELDVLILNPAPNYSGLVLYERTDSFIVARKVKDLKYERVGTDEMIRFEEIAFKTAKKIAAMWNT